MGQVNLTNITGGAISVNQFEVNGTSVGTGSVGEGFTLFKNYDDVNWDDFENFQLSINVSTGSTYRVNLSRNHFFGGGDFHYPGEGSDVNFILTGKNGSGDLTLKLAYRQAGATFFTNDNDAKGMNKEN
ncbi:hypothetical protein SCOR_08575 [Sulfidibacter corallicola]|uniref:Uncharacterized protein n=1 Tax=Sulfidibacter corallicola TaxID=2818388 RepID=A0A8A4TQC1_SULCO|nr:hypothetical protein [Sulfidibacter corallicola]QTD51188.1 hypothetical protein J3U87_01855 [Sulfidibacter corallicola]